MLWSVIALLFVTVMSAYMGFVAGRSFIVPPDNQNIAADEPDSAIPQPSRGDAPKYRLGVDNGRLAVYTMGKETPDLTFNVLVKYLPPVDQAALEKGIEIYDYNELSRLIEDYIS